MHLAAGLAFYAFLSLFPLALLLISVFGFFFNPEEVTSWLIKLFGEQTPVSEDFLRDTVQAVMAARGPIGILGFLGLVLSSTLVFGAVMRSINRAWGLMGTGSRTFLRRKLWEFALLVGVASLFLLSLGATSFFEILGQRPFPGTEFRLSTDNAFWSFFLGLIPFGATASILLLLYKFIPATKVRWRDVWLPSLLGAAAFKLTNSLLGWYIRSLGYYNAVYGPLTSVIVLLLWIYVCANILIFGAALCSVLAARRRQPTSSDSITAT
jgi:membrane protein